MNKIMKKDIVAGLGEIGQPILKVISKKELAVGYDLDKKLMETNTFVFPAIKKAIDARSYFSIFLPTVMSWLQYSRSSVESLAEDVVNALDDPKSRDTMQEILFSDNHAQEFSGVLNDLRKNMQSELTPRMDEGNETDSENEEIPDIEDVHAKFADENSIDPPPVKNTNLKLRRPPPKSK